MGLSLCLCISLRACASGHLCVLCMCVSCSSQRNQRRRWTFILGMCVSQGVNSNCAPGYSGRPPRQPPIPSRKGGHAHGGMQVNDLQLRSLLREEPAGRRAGWRLGSKSSFAILPPPHPLPAPCRARTGSHSYIAISQGKLPVGLLEELFLFVSCS